MELYKTYIVGGYKKKSEEFYFSGDLSELKTKSLTRRMLDISVENKYIQDRFMQKIVEIIEDSTYAWKVQFIASKNEDLYKEVSQSQFFKNTYLHIDILTSHSYNLINKELISYIYRKLKDKKIYFKEGLAKKVLAFYQKPLSESCTTKRISINYKVDIESIFNDLQLEFPEIFKVVQQTMIPSNLEDLLSSEIEHTIEDYPIKYAVIERVLEEVCFF